MRPAKWLVKLIAVRQTKWPVVTPITPFKREAKTELRGIGELGVHAATQATQDEKIRFVAQIKDGTNMCV